MTFKKVNKFGFLTARTNLRAGADKRAPVLMVLPKGTEIWVSARVDERKWYMVELKDKNSTLRIKGFIHSDLVAILKFN
jgi:hypothetical protein